LAPKGYFHLKKDKVFNLILFNLSLILVNVKYTSYYESIDCSLSLFFKYKVVEMKGFKVILGVALFGSSVVFGGGPFVPAPEADVEQVEPAIAEVPKAPEEEDSIRPYVGVSVGSSSADVSSQAKVCGGCEYDKINQTTTQAPDKVIKWGGTSESTSTGMALAGVEINDFLSIEGRLTKAISDYEVPDHQPISFFNAAIYLKPQYKLEMATVYGMIGYGYSSIDFMGKNTSSMGFQYGIGASYDVNDELSVFADYTKLYDGGDKISEATTMGSVSSLNAGVIYRP
jgi:hypothetical protein